MSLPNSIAAFTQQLEAQCNPRENHAIAGILHSYNKFLGELPENEQSPIVAAILTQALYASEG